MITWRDTISIICEMFGLTQQQLAGYLNIGVSTLSKIKNDRTRASFDSNAVFNAVFNPDTKGSPAQAKNETEKQLLISLKETIEFEFNEVQEAMDDCWEETDYRLFVIRLLGRSRQRNLLKEKTPDDSDKVIPVTEAPSDEISEIRKTGDEVVNQASFANAGGAQLHIEDKYICCRFCTKWRGAMNDELAACKVFKDQRTSTDGSGCKYYEPAEGRIAAEIVRCQLS